MTIPSSTDSPLVLGNEIAPDWGAEVFLIEEFMGEAMGRSVAGNEQRISYRPKPRKTLRYTVASCRIASEADKIATLLRRSRGPLLVPWWAEGLRISVTMAGINELQLEIPPGTCHDLQAGSRILVGDIPRQIAAITSKFVTLADDPSGRIEPVGTWVFPLRLAIMTDAGSALQSLRADTASQALQFVEL